MKIRRSNERGHFDHGWLDTYHTFSFAGYQDPEHREFRNLRVINEDVIAPAMGFGTHGHRDMEILTYVLSGAIAHRDSLGNGSTIPAGRWQRMTAGAGVEHSEFNPSESHPVHLYQIWIRPDEKGLVPEYEEWSPVAKTDHEGLRLVASKQGREGSMAIHADAEVFHGELTAGARLGHTPSAGRGVWLQIVRGSLRVDGETLGAGDGVSFEDGENPEIVAVTEAEAILFDVGGGN
jgi:redox-sensitive bicupin YhaK (pirin superfamily)